MLIRDTQGKELALIYLKADRVKEAKDQIVFISDDSHLVQVGIWNEYSEDHSITPHTHLPVERVTSGTHEMFYVESGKIIAYIYDDDALPVLKLPMEPGDILVQLSGGHTFEIVENETVVIEVKNGPFIGSSADKTPIKATTW